jgi:hypothetical protein
MELPATIAAVRQQQEPEAPSGRARILLGGEASLLAADALTRSHRALSSVHREEGRLIAILIKHHLSCSG